MSDNHDYLGTSDNPKLRLSADVLMLMLKGASYAAIFCLALWFILAAIHWVGLLLPEDSRFRPDPTPFSFHMNDQQNTIV
ncbi:RC-LH1 core complex protein PufX [Rhodobacteraceae bacterium]|nr:RC-LH1 core complex protein PufX [Paracoccaceae bacterium]